MSQTFGRVAWRVFQGKLRHNPHAVQRSSSEAFLRTAPQSEGPDPADQSRFCSGNPQALCVQRRQVCSLQYLHSKITWSGPEWQRLQCHTINLLSDLITWNE